MKKSIALTITALFISSSSFQAYFPSLTAQAFDPEYTVFEPPMIYSVYEEEGGIIPKGGVIPSEPKVLSQDTSVQNKIIEKFVSPPKSDIRSSFQEKGDKYNKVISGYFTDLKFKPALKQVGKAIDSTVRIYFGLKLASFFSSNLFIPTTGIIVAGKGTFDLNLAGLSILGGRNIKLPGFITNIGDTIFSFFKKSTPDPIKRLFNILYDYDYYEKGLEAAGELIDNYLLHK